MQDFDPERVTLDNLSLRIQLKEDELNLLKNIYRLRCELVTHEAAKLTSGTNWQNKDLSEYEKNI